MKKVEWIKDILAEAGFTVMEKRSRNIADEKIITIQCYHKEKNISVTSTHCGIKDYEYAYQSILKELLKFIQTIKP